MSTKKLRLFDHNIRSLNFVHMLQNRESGFSRYKLNQNPDLYFERQFYRAITPTLTLGVVIPNVYLRKFTPDGMKLLGFSQDQRSCMVYTFKGVGSAGLAQLLAENNFDNDDNGGLSNNEWRSQIFDKLFKLKFMLRLCQGESTRYYLHREFSIFLEDGRYALLAGMCILSSCNITIAEIESYPDIFDKVDPFSYVFFVVDLEEGIITDTVQIAIDAICLSHNHGVSVYGHTIAILSRLRQVIYIYDLVNGRLVKREHEIGPRPRDCIYNSIPDPTVIDANSLFPISHIKQRLLTFLYRRIEGDARRYKKYRDFYKKFPYIENMILEKMQLLDHDLLFLRYEERPNETNNPEDENIPVAPHRLYVFFKIESESVIGVYDDDSVDLLDIVIRFHNKICNVRSMQMDDVPKSPTQFFMRDTCLYEDNSAPFMRQAALRFNSTVPISSQSFSTSPYLNYHRFIYDDKLVSPLERPKPCTIRPIEFRDRATMRIKFRLSSKPRRSHNALAPRELCAFIFHPFEPLVISIQKCMHVYTYNIHFYNPTTNVRS